MTPASTDPPQDQLRAFLTVAQPQHSLDFLLLIGDPRNGRGPLAMKTLYPRNLGAVANHSCYSWSSSTLCGFNQEPVASDYWYSILDGSDWDGNGNGKAGEFGDVNPVTGTTGDFEQVAEGGFGDTMFTPAWSVGRIPHYETSSITILDGILQKTIDYETAALANIGWRRSGLAGIVGEPRIFFGEYMDQLWDTQSGYLGTHKVYDAENCWPCATPTCSCGSSSVLPGANLTEAPDALTCSEQNVADGWIARSPGLVTWITHGSGAGAQHVMDVARAFTLNDTQPAITFQASCFNAKPTTTNNIAYTLLRNGAVGTVASTVVSHGGLLSYGQQLTDVAAAGGITGMSYRFNQHLIDGLSTGKSLSMLKQNSIIGRCWYWQNYVGFVLYGDPTIRLGANADDAVDTSGQSRRCTTIRPQPLARQARTVTPSPPRGLLLRQPLRQPIVRRRRSVAVEPARDTRCRLDIVGDGRFSDNRAYRGKKRLRRRHDDGHKGAKWRRSCHPDD